MYIIKNVLIGSQKLFGIFHSLANINLMWHASDMILGHPTCQAIALQVILHIQLFINYSDVFFFNFAQISYGTELLPILVQ